MWCSYLPHLDIFINVDILYSYMISSELESLGFSKTGAKIYLALINNGNLSAGEIAKEIQINRRTVYDSIERLIENGYVSYILVGKNRVFTATNPKVLIQKIEEMKSNADKILPELEKLYALKNSNQNASIFQGKKGVKLILDEILNEKEYYTYGATGHFWEIMELDFKVFQKRKKQLGIKNKVLVNPGLKGNMQLKEISGNMRFLPENLVSPTTILIYSNKTAIIHWTEVPLGVLIESEEIHNMYKQTFDMLWNISSK